METTLQHTHPRRRRRFAALLVLALVTGSLGAGALSLALFTDTQAVDNNVFSTGTIDITTTPTTALFNATGMMPGDSVSRAILVRNIGTAQLRYAVSTTVNAGAALADQLQLAIYAGGACSGTPEYSGTLTGAAVGSNAAGADTGDRVLNAATGEYLCFMATLPATTSSSFQGASTTVTFTFDAEQTANNP